MYLDPTSERLDLKTNALQLVNESMFEWNVALIVLNPDSVYYGGYFKAKMTFPRDYPYNPPSKTRLRSQLPIVS